MLEELRDEIIQWLRRIFKGTEFENKITNNLVETLKDGIILCQVAKVIDPSLEISTPRDPTSRINNINGNKSERQHRDMQNFFMRENLLIYLRACKNSLGFQDDQLFDPDDLIEEKSQNLKHVLVNIVSLKQLHKKTEERREKFHEEPGPTSEEDKKEKEDKKEEEEVVEGSGEEAPATTTSQRDLKGLLLYSIIGAFSVAVINQVMKAMQ